MQSITSALLLILLGLNLSPGSAQDAGIPLVGTLDGYDVGGNHSICWTSQVEDTFQSTTSEPEKSLLFMNQELRSNPEGSLFQELPTCAQNGTNMTISRIDKPPDDLWVMWKGKPNTTKISAIFEMDLEVDVGDFANVAVDEDSLMVWYRVFMCAVPRVGFCQPLVDSTEWDIYIDPIVVPDDPFAVMPTVDSKTLTFDSVPTDTSTNVTFRTNWVASRLERVDQTQKFTGTIQLPTICWKSMGDRINYTVIGHATIQLPTSAGNDFVRVDVSSIFPGEPLLVATEPNTKVFDTGAIAFVSTLICVAGLITLGMFAYIIVHRNHRVMTMAQSGLLSGLAAASCTTIVMTFLLMPLEDIFCKLQGLLFIPATLMPTILVGRLWRVHTTLSVAHALGRGITTMSSSSGEGSGSTKLSSIAQQTRTSLSKVSKKSEEWIMKFLSILACSPCIQRMEQRRSIPSKRRSTNSLRRTTTRVETLLLIFLLTLPQVVVQLYDVITYWEDTGVWINRSQDVMAAREICRAEEWVTFFGAGYLALMFILAMYVAWCSRHLPSAFNEKDAVFRAGFLSGIIVILVTVGLSYSDIPEVSPNLTVSLAAIMIVSVSLITSWSVIMPKIRRVHGGETVVMTNILRDMNGVNSSSLSSEEEEYRRASQEAAARISSTGAITSSGPKKRVTHSKTILRHDEPIPKKMERHLYQLNGLAEAITDRWYVLLSGCLQLVLSCLWNDLIFFSSHSLLVSFCSAEGRPMDKTEWENLLRVTADLNIEFENVRMKFDDNPGMNDSYSESNQPMNNSSSGDLLEKAQP
jgi:7 transmembrane sweet-taste receptor of 3 GCPR